MEISVQLLSDIVDLEYEAQTYSEDEPIRPVLGPPCAEEELAALEAHLRRSGLGMPPSYRRFLELANGIRGFKSYFSLVPAAEVATPPHAGIRRGYPRLAPFAIGRGASLEFLAFDPDRISGDEPQAVFVADDGVESRAADFAAYLNKRRLRLQETVVLERADRRGRSR